MSWRPEGWKTEEIKNSPLHCFAPQQCADYFFEAGADAMLKSLEPLIKQIAPSSKLVDILYPKEEVK